MDQLDYLIDRKISGSITVSESNQLDQMILNKPEIEMEIEKRIDIAKAIKFAGNEELRKSLKQIHTQEFSQKSASKFISFKSLLSIAAIFALGTLSYMFLLNQEDDISGNQAYASYYEPYKASFQNRGDTAAVVFEQFKNAYSNGNHKDALDIVSEVMIKDIKDSEVLLAMGISALEIGVLDKAKDYFQLIIDSDDYFFKNHAKWYIALTYLKEEKIDVAKTYLRELSTNKKADHSQDAKELIAKIK